MKIAFLKDGTYNIYHDHHMIFLSQLDHQIPYWWRQSHLKHCLFTILLFIIIGVISVALKGEKKNRIEVIGEGIVDAAGLAETLRKKVGFADLVSVEEIKDKDDEELKLV